MPSLRIGLLTALLICLPVSASAAGSYLPTGIYALVPLNATTVNSQVLANPNVTGLQIRASWSLLQPSLTSSINFSYFDNLITKAKTNNKQVIIAVYRGLVGDGLPTGFASASLFTCGGKTGPKPWVTEYQNAWINFWTALVQYYESNLDLGPDVTGYHIGGIYSWQTVDWDLCDGKSADRNKWLKAGYTIESIGDFALDFVGALSNATTKPFILPVAGTMNNAGVVDMETNTKNYIMDPLFCGYGAPLPHPRGCAGGTSRLGFMRTTFQDTTPDPLGVWNSDDLGGQFGTLILYSPHIAGQRQALTFDLEMLEATLDISLHYDIQFMELGYQQINLSGAGPLLTCYHDALVNGTPDHCAHQ